MQLFVKAPSLPATLIACEPGASVGAVCTAYSRLHGLPDGSQQCRVVFEGRGLDPASSLGAAGVAAYGTLELLPRLRGGGGDGGSTGAESRSCYLEMYAGRKPDKVNPEEERLAKWTTCQLTGLPLSPPCVCDELGALFNKDAVIQALVGKTMPKALGHISSLKHLIDLKLEPSGSGKGGDGGAAFACPITGLALNGKARFVVVRAKGHVLSERALKEVPKVVEELVGSKVTAADCLPINPPAEELSEMRERLLEARAAARAAKKEGKKAKAAAAAAGANDNAAAPGAGAKRPAAAGPATAGGKAAANGATAPQQGAAGAAGAAAKKFKATELMPSHADKKVWESLFTSSRPEEKETYLCRNTAARGMHLS